MTNINVNKILRNGKAMYLACDQGLEHGPVDFNEKNIDPKYIFDIALEGKYDGVIVQNGIAEKYYTGYYKEVPLILKLNGKSKLGANMPFSRQLCSVDRAIKLGASAVGYTIFTGSPFEPEMLIEFSKIVEQAHDYGMPAIAWMYPRGPSIKNEYDPEILAYSARIGLELGADILKMRCSNEDTDVFKWVVKCAGKTKIMVSGNDKMSEDALFKKSHALLKTGVSGFAIGRNVWQHDKPYAISKALRAIVHDNKSYEEAMQIFNQGTK